MFSHYGANSQGLQISVGTNANSQTKLQVNANLLASRLATQGKGQGGGNIGHNTRKVAIPRQ